MTTIYTCTFPAPPEVTEQLKSFPTRVEEDGSLVYDVSYDQIQHMLTPECRQIIKQNKFQGLDQSTSQQVQNCVRVLFECPARTGADRLSTDLTQEKLTTTADIFSLARNTVHGTVIVVSPKVAAGAMVSTAFAAAAVASGLLCTVCGVRIIMRQEAELTRANAINDVEGRNTAHVLRYGIGLGLAVLGIGFIFVSLASMGVVSAQVGSVSAYLLYGGGGLTFAAIAFLGGRQIIQSRELKKRVKEHAQARDLLCFLNDQISDEVQQARFARRAGIESLQLILAYKDEINQQMDVPRAVELVELIVPKVEEEIFKKQALGITYLATAIIGTLAITACLVFTQGQGLSVNCFLFAGTAVLFLPVDNEKARNVWLNFLYNLRKSQSKTAEQVLLEQWAQQHVTALACEQHAQRVQEIVVYAKAQHRQPSDVIRQLHGQEGCSLIELASFYKYLVPNAESVAVDLEGILNREFTTDEVESIATAPAWKEPKSESVA